MITEPKVTRFQFRSDYGELEVTVSRFPEAPSIAWPQPGDIPADLKDALLEWLKGNQI